MESTEGRRLHGLAAQAREKGESVEALSLYHQALAAYSKDGDELGFAEVLSDEFLSLRHLYEKTGDKKWLILAKHVVMASAETAEQSGQKEALALPLFNLAKAHETLGELDEAVKNYKRALETYQNNPPQPHGLRPAMVADMQIHLAVAEYKAGDKSALERVEKALADLDAVPTTPDEKFESNNKQLDSGTEGVYNKLVWLSGAHMRIAEMLKNDNPEKAKEHLNKAKEIIDSDERLTLRAQQWEKLAQSF